MSVPEPRPGLEDRVLAKATQPKARRRLSNWWAAGIGALAATIAWVAVLWMQQGRIEEPRLVLALNESRDVSLVIDSERDLDGATIRLYVTGSVALAGYEDEHEIEWLASLTQGANLLSLPVVGRSPGDGRVVAVIEHQGRTRRVSVAMHVADKG
jgi:hypothetical protein